MVAENEYRDINDITFPWAFMDNLDHIALIIVLSIASLTVLIIFAFGYKSRKEFDELPFWSMLMSGILLVFSLLAMTIGGGANLHSERRLAMEHNIHLKYDIDLVDIKFVQREGEKWLSEGYILSSDDNLNIGYGDQAIEESDVDEFFVVFDANGEPKILPWAGASKEDVDKLLNSSSEVPVRN